MTSFLVVNPVFGTIFDGSKDVFIRCVPSQRDPEDPEDEHPLTVGDVAAKMSSDPELPKSHREIGKSLINNPTILPEWLSLEVVREIGRKLHLADERFLRFFRDTALQMMMGRGQAQMAATREKRSRRAGPKSNVKNKGNDNG